MTLRHRTRSSGASVSRDLPRVDSVEPGAWLFTCRAGFERDLLDELPKGSAVLAPALVVSRHDPPRVEARIELVFARQGFRVAASVESPDLAHALVDLFPPVVGPRWMVQAFVPDTDRDNPNAAFADELADRVAAGLESRSIGKRVERDGLKWGDATLAQLCVRSPTQAIAGTVHTSEALSLAPGGRERMRVPKDAPARSARKLAEAIAWLGMGPNAGETVVDLGAAPGGWTRVLVDRKARVIAVDPASLEPHIARMRGVRHVRASAFDYEPDSPADWLVCDMAWRPLEVAELLAKWGRRKYARGLIANFKLPMKEKRALLLRVKKTLEGGGWRNVRMRHLYHDRDEITAGAWRT
jgi:23S rRNA (cytidine2498-2'-O)-methyltransferase